MELNLKQKVKIINRKPDNTTGSENYNLPNGDVGSIGYIIDIGSNSTRFSVYSDIDGNSKYYGWFDADDLQAISLDKSELVDGEIYVYDNAHIAEYPNGASLYKESVDINRLTLKHTWMWNLHIRHATDDEKQKLIEAKTAALNPKPLTSTVIPDSKFNVGDTIDTNTNGYQYTDMGYNSKESYIDRKLIETCNVKTYNKSNLKVNDKAYSQYTGNRWYQVEEYGNWISEESMVLSKSNPESKPKFEVGKWYSFNWDWQSKTNGKTIIKVRGVTENTVCTVDRIYCYRNNDSNFSYQDSYNFRDISNIQELTDLSEIQQYLPDGHPDKVKLEIKEWSVGTYIVYLKDYGGHPKGTVDVISFNNSHGIVSGYLPYHESSECCNLIINTECKWFATKQEAEEFAKTLNDNPMEKKVKVFDLYEIGSIVVSLTESRGNLLPGDMFKVLPNSNSKVLYYKSGFNSSAITQWRAATEEEVKAFNEGITNINNINNIKTVKKDDKSRPLKTFEVGKWYTNPLFPEINNKKQKYFRVKEVEAKKKLGGGYYNLITFDQAADENWNIIDIHRMQSNTDFDREMVLVEKPEKLYKDIDCYYKIKEGREGANYNSFYVKHLERREFQHSNLRAGDIFHALKKGKHYSDEQVTLIYGKYKDVEQCFEFHALEPSTKEEYDAQFKLDESEFKVGDWVILVPENYSKSFYSEAKYYCENYGPKTAFKIKELSNNGVEAWNGKFIREKYNLPIDCFRKALFHEIPSEESSSIEQSLLSQTNSGFVNIKVKDPTENVTMNKPYTAEKALAELKRRGFKKGVKYQKMDADGIYEDMQCIATDDLQICENGAYIDCGIGYLWHMHNPHIIHKGPENDALPTYSHDLTTPKEFSTAQASTENYYKPETLLSKTTFNY